jgi:hypothetical protein
MRYNKAHSFTLDWLRVCFHVTSLLSVYAFATTSTLATDALSLVSVNRTGAAAGNRDSVNPHLSASGRFVVFSSDASDLVTNDNNNYGDVFLRDLLTGTTFLISVDNAGTGSGNNDSFGAIISANGRFVVFTSVASNLVPNDNNGLPDLFIHNLSTRTTTLVSVNQAGTGSGNGLTLSSVDPAITPDGRFVVFYSAASDLVANDSNNVPDLFVRDVVNGKTTLVSINRAGNAAGAGSPFTPSISADGRFIAFQSTANDLVANDPQRAGATDEMDIFVRDMQAGTTSLVSVNRAGTASGNALSRFPSMSADGRFIAFGSFATDLTDNDSNSYHDVYVRDRSAGTTTLVSVNRTGATSNNPSNAIGIPAISADGRFVAFASLASDLVANDTNSRIDVFLRDLQAGATTLVSRNAAGTNGGNNDSQKPLISADGRFVAFESLASDLAGASDTNGQADIFVRDMQAGMTSLVSVNSSGTTSGNNSSVAATLSADGQAVAFESIASNLAANDTNNLSDVFVRPGALQAAPTLLTQENTARAIALDSVTLMREPFQVEAIHNFSSDQRTRVMLFATHLEFAPGENSSALTVQAEDAQHRVYPLIVEYVGEVPNFYWLTQVVVKLPDQLENAGDVSLSISLRGATSNRALINIKPSGSPPLW